ncbi:MAG: hypothetical protein DPW16_22520 [Chloroflexi bacterium]|nr:hypothetical protein [Chloroflexota bacterium]
MDKKPNYLFTRQTLKSMALIILFGCVGPCLVVVAFTQVFPDFTHKIELRLLGSMVEWNFEDIVEYLDVPYPEGATDIQYRSNRFDRTFYLELSFKAPPASALRFAEGICGGILYQGYDPFNALATSDPMPGVHLVKNGRFTYYSYSPQASQQLFGHRCPSLKNGRTQLILLDKTDARFYQVRYEVGTSSNYQLYNLPTLSIGNNYINPMHNFRPFMMVGVAFTDPGYRLVTEEVCFETRQRYTAAVDDIYDDFIGAKVEIWVDDKKMEDAYISQYWVLSPKRKEAPDELFLFNHCLFQEWKSGKHTVEVRITPKEGNSISYSWEFSVEKNQ